MTSVARGEPAVSDLVESTMRLAGLPASVVLAAVGSRAEGLTAGEVTGRQRIDGPNRLPEPAGPGTARRLLAQMTHLFALLLWAAAAFALLGGMPQLAIAIVIVVIVNGLFSFAQEERAERATKSAQPAPTGRGEGAP